MLELREVKKKQKLHDKYDSMKEKPAENYTFAASYKITGDLMVKYLDIVQVILKILVKLKYFDNKN